MGKNDQLKQLKQRLLALRRREKQLQDQRTGLLYAEAVLVQLCDCFELMAVQTQAQSFLDNEHNVDHLLQLQTQLTVEMTDLLKQLEPEQQQLQAALQQDLQDMQGTAVLQEQGVQRVAPRHEPMAYFKHLVMQLAVLDVPTMTARELAGELRTAVLHSSLELQRTQMQQLPTDVQALQRAWNR